MIGMSMISIVFWWWWMGRFDRRIIWVRWCSLQWKSKKKQLLFVLQPRIATIAIKSTTKLGMHHYKFAYYNLLRSVNKKKKRNSFLSSEKVYVPATVRKAMNFDRLDHLCFPPCTQDFDVDAVSIRIIVVVYGFLCKCIIN